MTTRQPSESQQTLTYDEVCKLTRQSRSTLMRRVKDGSLPAIYLPGRATRFARDGIDAYLTAVSRRSRAPQMPAPTPRIKRGNPPKQHRKQKTSNPQQSSLFEGDEE